jgi:hypothetical protein
MLHGCEQSLREVIEMQAAAWIIVWVVIAILAMPPRMADAENHTATITIGAITLNVPLGQVPGLHDGAAVNAGTFADSSSALWLYYLLPEFEAPTDQNRTKFMESSWRQKIMIALTYPNRLGDRHQAMYGPHGFLSMSSPEVASSIEDYREFRWLRDAIYVLRSDPDFYFICTDEPGHSHAGPPGLAWWPSCTHSFSWHGVAVRYTFSVEFMKGSREIDTQVHQALDGMLVGGQRLAK